ncbi:MAG: translocation/assembly module TamB domain-containing protein [Rickettsiaceae bacterium]
MKLLLRSLLFLVIMFAMLIIPIFIWLQSNAGNEVINKFITEYVEKETDNNYKVKVTNLMISFPLVIEVQKIAFSDKEGLFGIIEEFHIDVLPSLAWLWRIDVNEISAQKINLLRLPNSNVGSVDSVEVDRKKTEFIPGIAIQDIIVQKFVLSPELTGFVDEVTFGIQGYINVNSKTNKLNFQVQLKTNFTEDEVLDKKLSLIKDAILETKGTFNFANNSINIESFKFASLHSNIDGEMDINFSEDLLSGTVNYNSSILEQLFPDRKSLKSLCSGKIDFSGKLSTPYITTDGNISIIDGDQNYVQLPSLNWKSDFIFSKKGMNGKISFDGGVIKAQGEIGKDGSKLYLKNFTVNNAQTVISTASFLSDDKTKVASGILNIKSANIYEFKEFFPFLTKGKLDIKAIYEQNASGAKKLDIVGNVKRLASSLANCDFIDFDVGIKILEDLKLERADITAQSLVSDYGDFKSFSLKAREKDNFIDFVSQIESAELSLMNVKINSKLFISSLEENHDDRNMNLRFVNDVNGTMGGAKINTQEPITIIFGKVFSISAPDIKVDDGKLNLDLTLNDSQVKGNILVTKFPAAVGSKFLPASFDQSLISGNAELDGSKSAPVFNSVLEIAKTKSLDKENIATVLKLSSYIQNNNLSISAHALQEDQMIGTLNLQIPCTFSLLPFEFSLLKKDNISANLKLDKEVNILALLPLSGGHKLMGYLGGNVSITGNLESPVIDGMISVTKAEYKYQVYGIKMKDISAKIIAKNKNISIMNFIAQDSYSNVLEGSGDLSIYNELPFKFHINTKKFSFINSPYLQGEIGGALSISGNSTKALAKGKFDLGPMEIKIPEHFSDNIPTINIVKTINHDKTVREIHDEPYILDIDVDLNTKHQVYVRGCGVNTLLSGSLKITNNIANPHIFGKLKSVKGRYQEFGKFLTVREGVLTFNGPISPSTYLNIVGVTTSGDTEIRLILSGSIFEPDVTIESTPVLSQQEALSLLLFGNNPDNISTMQAVGLADGMRKLSGNGGGFDPLGLGRKILGVDDISIKNDNDTESSYVGVGKYLADKVYLEVEQGNQAFGTKTKIEVEVTPKISIEAITGEKGDSSFGVNWRFDY